MGGANLSGMSRSRAARKPSLGDAFPPLFLKSFQCFIMRNSLQVLLYSLAQIRKRKRT